MNQLKIGCVVMASGLSSRFGRNKLLESWEGKSLIDRALEAVPCEKLHRVVVVTRFPEIQILAERKRFDCVWNDRPEDGISRTISLGLQQLHDSDATLFMVCDQPRLTRGYVSAMLDFYRGHPENIVCMSFGGERGNPCVFPSAFFPELLALRGDTGGSAVIQQHEPLLLRFEVSNASELIDVDHPGDLLM